MAINSLAPGFIIVYYVSNSHPHKHIIPIANPLDSGGGEWTIERQDGTDTDVDVAMLAWTDAVKAMFATTSTFQYWELWTKADENADPIFRETGDLAITGTTGATQANSQLSANYRTKTGGNGKVVLMETNQTIDVVSKPTYGSAKATLATYLLGVTNIYAGRDGGFIAAVPTIITKTNDKLRKKYLLNVS